MCWLIVKGLQTQEDGAHPHDGLPRRVHEPPVREVHPEYYRREHPELSAGAVHQLGARRRLDDAPAMHTDITTLE